ncbi:MAG: T9SS type A sorting domain-containing protein [Cryomorphaceae bacterium]
MNIIRALILSFIFSSGNTLSAQHAINLSIEHYVQDEPLVFNQASQTHERHAFDVTRMQYYLSEISVLDEDGNTHSFDSLWVFVDASVATDVELGSGSMDSIVSITIHVGVDSAHNHLDPSSWPNDHPLAHKTPSMHWGWANGYRFNAMEGNAGENLTESYELHGVGDENYFSVTVPTAAGVVNDVIDVTVYANYAEVLRGLDISGGIISHGPIYEAQTSLENMRDYVFGSEVPESTVMDSEDSNALAIAEMPEAASVLLFPNPTSAHQVRLLGFDPNGASITVDILDARGVHVMKHQLPIGTNKIDVSDLSSGIYLISLATKTASGTQRNWVRFLKL